MFTSKHLVLTVPVVLLLAGCGGSSPATGSSGSGASARTSAQMIRLQGAGSTFDTPLFSKVFDAFQKQSGVQINYQSIGSGGGVRQLTAGTVDFGASDYPLNDEQEQAAAASGGPVVHVPVAMGAVSVGYNLPVDGLKLDGPTLPAIYLGQITQWNDARIAKLNPGVTLPHTSIAVVHRSDGSGTTFIFTSYLAAVSPEWKSKVGASGAVMWPAGIGAKGSEGVSGQVTNTPGRHRLLRDGLRQGEQHQVGDHEERRRQVRRAERRGHGRRRRRRGREHARRPEGGVRRRAGRHQLSDRRLQLDRGVQEPARRAEGPGDRGHARSTRSPRASSSPRISTTRRCPSPCSSST